MPFCIPDFFPFSVTIFKFTIFVTIWRPTFQLSSVPKPRAREYLMRLHTCMLVFGNLITYCDTVSHCAERVSFGCYHHNHYLSSSRRALVPFDGAKYFLVRRSYTLRSYYGLQRTSYFYFWSLTQGLLSLLDSRQQLTRDSNTYIFNYYYYQLVANSIYLDTVDFSRK